MLVAWGFTENGERVLLAVMLGMRESHEDWLALEQGPDRPWARRADADRGRRRARADQGRRAVLAGLRPSSTAPFTACATCWPSCLNANANASARAYWQALDDATGARDGKQRLQALVDELEQSRLHRRREMPGRRPGRARRPPALPDQTPPPDGDRRTCSSDHYQARSNAAPR